MIDEIEPAPRTDYLTLTRKLSYLPGARIMTLDEWVSKYISVEICDMCGCLHRSYHIHVCDSCFEAVRRVQRQQAMYGFLRAAREMAEAFRNAGGAVGDGLPYGHSPAWQALQSYGRALRKHHEPPVVIRLGEPDACCFAARFIDPVPAPAGVDQPLLSAMRDFMDGYLDPILTPTAIPRKINFPNIPSWPVWVGPQDTEPVMKRNARNRGPKPRGKWWLK